MRMFINSLFSLFVLVSSFFVSSSSYASTPSVAKKEAVEQILWPDVVDYARKNLPLHGTLQRKEKGFVYLKVDDEYIHTLFPKLELESEGYKKPPYFRSKTAPGAHISVFYETENVNPEEIGTTYRFELARIVLVKPAKDTTYAVLQVVSPELEALRTKYGKTPKLHNHEFHISIAKKVENKKKR